MPDSIYPANLPAGYPAYLGYVDGHWPTYSQLETMFPAAYLIGLTVTGGTLNADGIDVEFGNPDAASGCDWTGRKLEAAPGSRPVIYASVVGEPGYGMHDVVAGLNARRIPLSSVRLLSAHYTSAAHICGPGTCGLISQPMDGTQWTDKHPGNSGSLIDMSVLLDSFFVKDPPPDPPQEDAVQIPGWQGTWLTFQTFPRSDGATIGVGLGRNGDPYYVVRDAGSASSHAPVKI
jgi:hypothetical protein